MMMNWRESQWNPEGRRAAEGLQPEAEAKLMVAILEAAARKDHNYHKRLEVLMISRFKKLLLQSKFHARQKISHLLWYLLKESKQKMPAKRMVSKLMEINQGQNPDLQLRLKMKEKVMRGSLQEEILKNCKTHLLKTTRTREETRVKLRLPLQQSPRMEDPITRDLRAAREINHKPKRVLILWKPRVVLKVARKKMW